MIIKLRRPHQELNQDKNENTLLSNEEINTIFNNCLTHMLDHHSTAYYYLEQKRAAEYGCKQNILNKTMPPFLRGLSYEKLEFPPFPQTISKDHLNNFHNNIKNKLTECIEEISKLYLELRINDVSK